MSWQVQQLLPSHVRTVFDCRHPSLNDFLSKYARQYADRGIARTYVVPAPNSTEVAGYYSISAYSVERANWPERPRKKLPHHPIPVALVGRLAVDHRFRGQRLGATLLRDALTRSLQVSEVMGVHAVLVEAIDGEAVAFYQRYGFAEFEDQPQKLFLPLAEVAAALGSTESPPRG